MISTGLACVSLAIWVYLLLGRGFFWRARERDSMALPPAGNPAIWPAIAVIIPARDEADMIARSVGSLLDQDYRGDFQIFVVDDQSSDGTAEVARKAADTRFMSDRLTVLIGGPVPHGWTGKPWAMQQGFMAVEALQDPPSHILFTDADILYDKGALQRLVEIATAENTVLTSLMVKLRAESLAERWLVPAFVFFFQMLYPFAWVNDRHKSTAAAAGGCMLIRRAALRRAGGIEALQGALIDDCAMGALLKKQGPVWLGLTESVHSLRAYPSFSSFAQMVSRSAYAELRYSVWRLAGAVLGMILTYLVPPVLALTASGLPQAIGILTWILMAVSFAPILKLYQRPGFAGLALPLIAGGYLAFTVQSALHYWQGRGGYWKGRVQAPIRQVRNP